MRRDAPRIGVEVLLLGLILAVLGAAVTLLVQAQGRAVVKVPAAIPTIAVVEKQPDPPQAVVLPEPTPVPVDVTADRLRPIEALIAKEKARSAAARQRTEGLLEAANLALDEAKRLRLEEIRRREALAVGESRAASTEDQRDRFARERDILAEKRDDAREALERQRLRSRDGVAVLPYKGPNGTWRRPIAIECRGDTATLRPGGPSFSIDDMTSFPNPRRSPLVYAVAKAMVRARSTRTPDGAASVPYLMFVVRPDGIRPYYAARTLLEPLGITYGYELADADWDIEFPDLDDPSEWTEIPAAKPATTWPPPPVDPPGNGTGLAAKGSRDGNGNGPSGVDPGGRPLGGNGVPGLGGTANTGRSPIGGFGAGGSQGTAGQLAIGNPAGGPPGSTGTGTGLGARPLASPGDGRDQGGQGTGATPWGRSGHGSGDAFDMTELERLGSGDSALAAIPRDGRMPWRPGQVLPPVSPAFQPTLPSGEGSAPVQGAGGDQTRQAPGGMASATGSAGDGSSYVPPTGTAPSRIASAAGGAGDGSGQPLAGQGSRSTASSMPPLPSRGPSSPNPAGNGGGTSRAGGQPVSVVGTDSLRDAIARRNGLVAPTVPGSSSTSSTSGSQGSASGAASSSTASSGGSPGGGGGGGPSGGAAGGHGGSVRDPFASQAFPIVVSCDRAGLTIHPGGETIPFSVVSRDDTALPAKLRALVKARQDTDPDSGLRPRVNFLVKPGGEVTYLKARWQATTGTSYPTTWQLVDRGGPRMPDLEAR